ncbi:MAG: guanylate kinase [Candidatus Bipolaricaulis sp.]|nr:guanylate kinase [Candidatus Bipolaricaulis sp.]MDD5219970.1 guanylate kinase [Candidatus Bipolaricaulis sp.]
MSSDDLTSLRRGTGRGLAFVVSGPSGAGKNTAISALIARVPGLAYSVSHTTRTPRPGERDGVDYYFVSEEEFAAIVAAGEFIEHAVYLGDRYGTSKAEIARLTARSLDVVLNVDVQGAITLRRVGVPGVTLAFVFFAPPSLAQLGERLRARGSESEAEIAERLRVVAREMKSVGIFDYLVLNGDLATAVEELRAIVMAERLCVVDSA